MCCGNNGYVVIIVIINMSKQDKIDDFEYS